MRLTMTSKTNIKRQKCSSSPRSIFLQQYPIGKRKNHNVPPIVREVLHSPGRPLDAETRTLMESRFNNDLSRVRVYNDAKSVQSTHEVDAHAYTVGNKVVFGYDSPSIQTTAGRRLLAHELTHVVQQKMPPGISTQLSGDPEREAYQNSQLFTKGLSFNVNTTVRHGSLLREEPKRKYTSERTGGYKTEEKGLEKKISPVNKYSFTADLEIPLGKGFNLGPFAFLDKLDIKVTGGKKGEELVPMSEVFLDKIQTEVALRLAKWELSNIEWDKIGQLSLGTKLSSTASVTRKFSPEPGLEGSSGTSTQKAEQKSKYEGSLGTSLGLGAGFTSASLLSPKSGKLTTGLTLEAAGSLTGSFGEEEKFTPEIGGKTILKIDYASPSFRSPYLTFGRLLGEEASLSLGGETSLSREYSKEKTGYGYGAAATFGIRGKTAEGKERFIKVKVSGDVAVDHKKGETKSSTSSYFIGLSTGFTLE